jgi:large subunit ribosomal protein L25
MSSTLQAEKRETRGKNEARRLRASGKIPAVVYGGAEKGKASEIAVDPKVLLRILHSESGVNTLIGLEGIGSGDTRVMVKEYQLDPVTHKLLHADFFELAMDRAITVTVPIAVKGEPKGVKQQGGLLDFVTRDVQVQCLPTDIPERIDVDVSELMLHESIRVRDLPQDPKWKPLNDPDTMIVHVILPKVEEVAAETPEAEAAAATAAPAEPEVIKKGKVEKEGEEPAAKK